MTPTEFRYALEITLAFWLDAAERDAHAMAETRYPPMVVFHRRQAEKNLARAIKTMEALNQ